MIETWRDVKGYESVYQVSDLGRVRSLKYGKERILKSIKSGCGYFYVDLSQNKKAKKITVHRLVAQAFIKNPQNKRTVSHINGTKTDNKLSNLEWATYSETQKHSYANGLKCTKGEKNGQQKLTKNQVLEIRRLCAQGMKAKDVISKLSLDVHLQTISNIKTRKTWTHI